MGEDKTAIYYIPASVRFDQAPTMDELNAGMYLQYVHPWERPHANPMPRIVLFTRLELWMQRWQRLKGYRMRLVHVDDDDEDNDDW